MTSKQRAYLKGLAMTMEPIFQIGKSSLTPENTQAISEGTGGPELIKISVLNNCMDDPRELARWWQNAPMHRLYRSSVRKLCCTGKERTRKRRSFFPDRRTVFRVEGGFSTMEQTVKTMTASPCGFQKIGVFGGSYNPVHCGHLQIAEAAREQFGLDQVWFVPAWIQPFKQGMQVVSANHRRQMLELALEPYLIFGSVTMSWRKKVSAIRVIPSRR